MSEGRSLDLRRRRSGLVNVERRRRDPLGQNYGLRGLLSLLLLLLLSRWCRGPLFGGRGGRGAYGTWFQRGNGGTGLARNTAVGRAGVELALDGVKVLAGKGPGDDCLLSADAAGRGRVSR